MRQVQKIPIKNTPTHQSMSLLLAEIPSEKAVVFTVITKENLT